MLIAPVPEVAPIVFPEVVPMLAIPVQKSNSLKNSGPSRSRSTGRRKRKAMDSVTLNI